MIWCEMFHPYPDFSSFIGEICLKLPGNASSFLKGGKGQQEFPLTFPTLIVAAVAMPNGTAM